MTASGDDAPDRRQRADRGRAGHVEAGVVDHRTGHWTGVGAVAFVFGGLGIALREPALLLAGVVGAVFTGYARSAEPIPVRDPETGEPALSIRRRLEPDAPEPGEDVTVTVELRNEGAGVLTDVRIVDGVPPALDVTDGTPRHGAVLRPDEGVTYAYTVTATRGEHDWRPAQITVADPSGAVERETTVDAPTTLSCSLPALTSEQLPLRGLTTPYVGRVDTDEGGSGVEFFSTREYRSSDPLSRIDWRRHAKTGELGTLEYREERAATVMLVIDTRQAAYRAPEPGAYHAVERSVDAANRVFAALLDTGDRVGVTTLGPASEECWLSPGAGDEHRAHGRALLNSHPALSPIPPDEGLFETIRDDRREQLKDRQVTRLRRRLSADTQVFVFSPCCDGYVPTVARRLDAHGQLVTVLSPDPTTDDTPIRELASMERADRLDGLRGEGIRVLDWRDGESFAAALARAQARWSA
ncbi:conserved repeat domain protein [Halorhabdus utahensis DSM 12940]|uniref:Conserved repeat domain protein n=1 Tax=Halorhabdus utahensis (strain DSM 12940 / JCM 11049 / AX-2) TaxID=519442 RepID=C7NMN6_HALUD|nr:DUF58 domain-containing protein [Halorhabdus utahensis]ACV11349.1 conserved repeat domain protein [Halorhabdus utahensis DSM 12940]